MLERPGEREQEQQGCPFAPRPDARAAGGHSQHEEVDVDRALLQPFPHFLHREPTAGEISEQVTN